VEDLTPTREPNEVMCRMNLDLDGILKVTAIEKRTGKSKYIIISNALKPINEAELTAAQERLKTLYSERSTDLEEAFAPNLQNDDYEQETCAIDVEDMESEDDMALASTDEILSEESFQRDPDLARLIQDAQSLITRSQQLLSEVHDEDKEEIISLHEQIKQGIAQQGKKSLIQAKQELEELLFFIEGK